MTQAIERARPQRSGIRQFGDLPPATSSMDLDRALELAGVDEPELVLLASTTFKECSSMEELITLIATVRRRGLDPMLKQVYYERFGGESSGPSLHIGIDGLRTIAVKTGRYVGAGEPRFSDIYDMATDDRGATKPVPAKCAVTVFANNGGRVGAFEGVAFMDECYPGPGARGRMWRARPRGMLAVAAERQALRRAFPAETGGLADVDEGEGPVQRTVVVDRAGGPSQQEQAATYERIYGDTERLVNTATGEVLTEPAGAGLTTPPVQPAADSPSAQPVVRTREEVRRELQQVRAKAKDLGIAIIPLGHDATIDTAEKAILDIRAQIAAAERALVNQEPEQERLEGVK